MGLIDQYCMVVKKKELNNWTPLGWLPWDKIGFPKEELKADLLYGKIARNEVLI